MICSNSQYHGDEPEIEYQEQLIKEQQQREAEETDE